jgi:hypothetical protein
MNKIPKYQTLDEKSKHFNIVKVETIDDFKHILTNHKKTKGIYRGVSESNYKIYSSLQRKIIETDLQDKFCIKDYLNNFRQNKILGRYFDIFKIKPSKLSIYSYLQHFRAPTPFIDFTSNIEKAIFFAIEKHKPDTCVEQGLIGNYFTIFYINNDDLDLIEIPDVLKSFKDCKRSTHNFISKYEDYTNQILESHIDDIFSNNTLNLFLIRHYEEFVDLYNIYNNIRIVAQEGLFIHNDFLDKPLEEALKFFFKRATQYVASELDDIDNPSIIAKNEKYMNELEKNKKYQLRLERNIITSFEINKSLICEIRKCITLQKEDIYPDPENLCWQIFEDSIPK